jgi:hydrogenase maturation protease
MSEAPRLLVLGLGNVLLEDDGVGPAAVALLLDRYEPPPDARVLDGGTLGLALLPYLEEAEVVVLVDAVKTEDAPGALVRLDGQDVGPAVATRLSVHQIGVADLLDGARWRDRYPARVVLLGIVPESFELGIGLSVHVQSALSDLVERVVDEARALGFVFQRRGQRDPARPVERSPDLARLAGVLQRGQRPAPAISES